MLKKSMRSTSLIALAAAFAVSACDSPAENATENQAEAVEEAADAQADAMENHADAMDTQTEQLFVERLQTAIAPGQTLIISTHRVAVLNIVDRLIVMDNGRIVADGPRKEILAVAGLT